MIFSVVERSIRSIKKLFFSMLYTLRNQSYTHILKLCEQIHNNRKHRGIYSEKPILCHYDSHIAAWVAKKNIESFQNQQKQIKNIFKPGTDLAVGNKVLLRKRKSTFHRDNVIFNAQFHDTPRKILEINDKVLPHTYKIESFPSRYFYRWELKKITSAYGFFEKQTPDPVSKIQVLDFYYENPPTLRNNKSLNNRRVLHYKISRDNKIETISEDNLRFFKRIFGKDSLEFAPLFHTEENKNLMF